MRWPGRQRKIVALGLLRNTGYGLSCKTSVTCKKTAFQLISTYLREELRSFPCITPLMLTWSWRHILIVWERITGQKLFVSKENKMQYPNERGRKCTVKALPQGTLILFYNKIQRHVSFFKSWDNVLTNDHGDEKASNTVFIFHTFPVPQRYIRVGHVYIVFQPDTFLVKNL